MRCFNGAVAFLFVFLALAAPSLADQTFFLVQGRTNQISTDHKPFGDISSTVFVNVRISDEALVSTVEEIIDVGGNHQELGADVYNPSPKSFVLPHTSEGRCEGSTISNNSVCVGLREINSCDFNSLSTRAKEALRFLLGNCQKSCVVAMSPHPSGVSTSYQWSCNDPRQAECILFSGMEDRIDVFQQVGGCQF